MSYRLVHSALYTGGLQTTQKIVLMALADFANDATGECWPAQETLANLCGMSRKTCNQAIKALTAKGIVTGAGWHGKTPLYRLHLSPTVTPVTESYTKAPVTESYTYLLPTVTPPVTQGYTKVLPTVTQTDNINREDNKETNKQASNSILSNNIENPPKEPTPKTEKPTTKTETPKMNPQVIQTPTAQAKPLPACPAAAANVPSVIKGRELKEAALAKLKVCGMDEQTATGKLDAVWSDFVAEAMALKANGYPGISNPKAYLTAKLVGMAKKGPKQAAPQAKANLTAEEALKALTAYYQTSDEYKAIAEHIPDILDSPWHREKLEAEAKSNWGGKDPLDVAKRIYGKRVAEKAQYWLESARQQEYEAVARKRRRQAEKQAVDFIEQRKAQEDSKWQKVILDYLRKRVDIPLDMLQRFIAEASANHWEGMTEFRWADVFVAAWEANKAKSA